MADWQPGPLIQKFQAKEGKGGNSIAATVKGGDELVAQLFELSRADQRQFKAAIRRDLRAAMATLRDAARADTPVKTGRLQKAIKVRAWVHAAPGEIGVKLIINAGTSRDDQAGAWYGKMIEFGHTIGNRYFPGRYMLTMAYDKHGDAAAQQVAAGILAEADKIMDKQLGM